MEQNKIMNLVKTAVLVAVVVLSVNLAPKVFTSEAKNVMALNQTLRERAEIMNRDCPFVLDENIRLDSVTSPEENILQNNFTLLKDQVDDIDIGAFQNIFKPEIAGQLKTMPEAEDFRKRNATLVYRYFDRDKNFVTDVVVLPGEY